MYQIINAVKIFSTNVLVNLLNNFKNSIINILFKHIGDVFIRTVN